MCYIQPVLITLLFIVIGSFAIESPEVQVQEGLLRGKFRTTRNQRSIAAFEGIPYAKPPIKQLRFLPPIPVEPWKGIRNATEVHNVCPQRDIYRRTTLIEGDEDCLYLNVYTPQVNSSDGNSLPVMIFFHGGGFLCGGGNSLWYGPDVLLDRDVVLVVPNYRLGALGFLSTGDKIQPGNNGLKDQNLAIKWVKNNIAKFGGDPGLITLFGESAGGASVQFHMISPLSRGLFKSGISQSGTAHCLWSLSPKDQAVENGKQLAKAFNCTTESSIKMVECLREIPAYDIIAQDEMFMKWDTDPMIPFKPVIEPNHKGAFMTQHPIDAIKSGEIADVPWMTGLNTDDGALRAAGLFANPHLLEELDQRFNEVIPISLEYDQTSQHSDFITKKIRKFYLGDKALDQNAVKEVVDMYTDGWFLNCADEAVRYHLKYNKQPVYYYLFGHRGVASFTKIFGDKERDYGVCHADDLQYLFPVSDGLFPDTPPDDSDKRMAEILTNLWVNFARTGNPTPDDENPVISDKWTPVETDNMEYYHIDCNKPHMKNGLLIERAKFWRKLPIHEKVNEIKDEL